MARFSDREGGMFDGLKARLGFGGDDARDDGYQDDQEYDDFGDYDDEFAGYGEDYDENAPIADENGFLPINPSSARRGDRYGRSGDFPRLVSIDDVKAHTAVPDRLRRDPLDSGDRVFERSARVGERTLVDDTAPAPSSPAHNAAQRERQRADGLNSLFEPTTGVAASASGEGGYDPYEAYSSASPSAHAPKRSLTVIRPVAYGDVERVSRAVKSGDVVVLVLRSTPDDLSKRILDFSFGVASALDASVECPGDKVFAIARGRALDESEKARLRSQGAL